MESGSTPLGRHFAGACGYASWQMQVSHYFDLECEPLSECSLQIIDRCEDAISLRRREGYWQRELATMAPCGLNVRNEASADLR